VQTIDISHSNEILTVSRLNREVRFILEGSFATLWIEGEISNFSAPSSGHWYFSLKDANAQVRCAMFKMHIRNTGCKPKDGIQVLIKARVSLYEGRGDFQLLVEHMEEAGEGRLRQEFEALKKRLSAAGLFDEIHKKSFPRFPKTIGIITSPTGAAIRDALSVLKRRYAHANIIIYPTLVQGDTAATHIVRALQIADSRQECDVLLLTRGGGSLEDLWPFNEEIVAYAIHSCTIPIISGVGHEIDFTIADFVADMRAPTPSAAAELVAPASEELLDTLLQEERHLFQLFKQKLAHAQQNVSWLKKQLDQQHPKRRLTEQTQRLDLYEAAFIRLQNKLQLARQSQLHTLTAKLAGLTPAHQIKAIQQHLIHDEKHFQNCLLKTLHAKQTIFSNLAGKLDALSPLSTLQRGFAIVTTANQQVVRKATDIHIGDKVNVRLCEGQLECKVEKISNKSP
jgi:exodeoxyribonuclease VII large subunit